MNYYKRSKYKNKKIEYDGRIFDSSRELKRYKELKILEENNEIQNLQMQVKYELIPAQREPDVIGPKGGVKKGKLIERECSYYADFVYIKNGETIVEDTKGMRTTDYIIKRKLMLFIHNIKINEI